MFRMQITGHIWGWPTQRSPTQFIASRGYNRKFWIPEDTAWGFTSKQYTHLGRESEPELLLQQRGSQFSCFAPAWLKPELCRECLQPQVKRETPYFWPGKGASCKPKSGRNPSFARFFFSLSPILTPRGASAEVQVPKTLGESGLGSEESGKATPSPQQTQSKECGGISPWLFLLSFHPLPEGSPSYTEAWTVGGLRLSTPVCPEEAGRQTPVVVSMWLCAFIKLTGMCTRRNGFNWM